MATGCYFAPKFSIPSTQLLPTMRGNKLQLNALTARASSGTLSLQEKSEFGGTLWA